MSDVTRIIVQIERGDTGAAERLLPLIYDELKKLAAAKLAQEPSGQTLQATALVHEAYLRLVSDAPAEPWNGRGHFFGAAAEAMRRILVENARRKKSLKRGGQHHRVPADPELVVAPSSDVDVVALDEALTKLAGEAPTRAELVKLRFFAGLTMPEAAHALGISVATAERYWNYSRTWLYAELNEGKKESVKQKSESV